MRRSRWNASISRKTLRKPPGGSASSTRYGKSRSFLRPTISRLRRVISPSPPPLLVSPPGASSLHFEPIGRAAGTVGRILALRHDAFKTHFASVREDGRTVALDMLVEPDAGAGPWPRKTRALPCGPQADRPAGRRRSVRSGRRRTGTCCHHGGGSE